MAARGGLCTGLGAIARVVLEQGWEDKEWIKKWVNKVSVTRSGYRESKMR